MQPLFEQTVFSVGAQDYTRTDVVLAAIMWGAWHELKQDVQHGVACLKRMKETGDAPSQDEVDAAVKEFRYEHDLLTGEEARQWLKRWELSLEDWTNYFRYSLLRHRWTTAELEDLGAQFPVDAKELGRYLKVESICSGRLARWTRKLAGRAAVYEMERAAATGDGCVESPVDFAVPELSEVEEALLGTLSHEVFRARMEQLWRFEKCYEAVRRRALTPEAIESEIDSHFLPWLKFDCRHVSFRDEGAAREAALCVREDGQDLSAVAAEARADMHETIIYLEQAAPELKEDLLGAEVGALVGPFRQADAFTLYLVVDKIVPSAGDAETRRRAEKSVLRVLLEHEINRRVRWHTDG
ncbi:MAG TPA: hypothetical protein VGW12_04035 [Pyrinomonadaceae bacterium]|nr:hypothetical protein [Pyrinomonadaceae bacterium]